MIASASVPDPPPKSTGLLAQLTARITPNKSQTPAPPPQLPPQQQQQQNDNYDRTRNEPIYQQQQQRRAAPNQYYDNQTIYGQQQQQQQPQDQQIDGKNQIYSTSPHHQIYQQQQHQFNVYNQNIYVSTNPFISPPSGNYSPSSFGKEVTANSYSSNELGTCFL